MRIEKFLSTFKEFLYVIIIFRILEYLTFIGSYYYNKNNIKFFKNFRLIVEFYIDNYILAFIICIIQFFIVWYFYKKFLTKNKISIYKLFNGNIFKKVLMFIISYIILFFFISYFLSYNIGKPTIEFTNLNDIKNNFLEYQGFNIYKFFTNLSLFFISALKEEIFFRIILFITLLYLYNSFVCSILFSSFIFYLHHIFKVDTINTYFHLNMEMFGFTMFALIRFLELVVFGIMLCLTFVITKNIWVITISHWFNNVIIDILIYNKYKIINIITQYSSISKTMKEINDDQIFFYNIIPVFTMLLTYLIIICFLVYYLYKNKHLIKKFYEAIGLKHKLN